MAGEMIARAILEATTAGGCSRPSSWSGPAAPSGVPPRRPCSGRCSCAIRRGVDFALPRSGAARGRGAPSAVRGREGGATGRGGNPPRRRRQRDALPRRKRAVPPPRRRHDLPRSVRVRPRRTQDLRAKKEDGSPRRPGWRTWRERRPRAPPPRRRCRSPPTPRWLSQDKSKSIRPGSHHPGPGRARCCVASRGHGRARCRNPAEVTTAPDVARAPDVPVPDAPVIEPASEPVATAPADAPPAKPNQPRKRSPGGKRPRVQPPGRRRIPGRSFA